jgi:hypothetical protein
VKQGAENQKIGGNMYFFLVNNGSCIWTHKKPVEIEEILLNFDQCTIYSKGKIHLVFDFKILKETIIGEGTSNR